MLFNRAKSLAAIEIPLNWNAEYFNGENLSEYNLETKEKNDFYTIEKQKDQSPVARFGLFGQGNSMFFETTDGSFNINGKRVEINYIESNGNVLNLTTNFNKKDLITYKEAYTEYNNKQGVQKSNLSSINFGYKTTYEKEDIQIYFQAIVCAPINENFYIEVKMTANKKLDGELIFKSRDKVIDSYYAPLEENHAGQINWDIK